MISLVYHYLYIYVSDTHLIFIFFKWQSSLYLYLLRSVEMPEENKRTESSLEEERGLLVCSTDSYQSIEASSGVVINSDSLNSNYNFAGLRRSYSPQFASSLNTEGSEVEWSFSWNGFVQLLIFDFDGDSMCN